MIYKSCTKKDDPSESPSTDDCAKLIIAAYELGYKESKCHIVKKLYDDCIMVDKATGDRGFICIEALTELVKQHGLEV